MKTCALVFTALLAVASLRAAEMTSAGAMPALPSAATETMPGVKVGA